MLSGPALRAAALERPNARARYTWAALRPQACGSARLIRRVAKCRAPPANCRGPRQPVRFMGLEQICLRVSHLRMCTHWSPWVCLLRVFLDPVSEVKPKSLSQRDYYFCRCDHYFQTRDYYFGRCDYYFGSCDHYFARCDYYFRRCDYYLHWCDYYFTAVTTICIV